ncbi:anti-sigma factor [Paenibacillus selenitireducens]|uniref:Anti-sigma-W factor RsiW n=1 Tax=Paenibacillus selenitireducens TaxID=1324314 RepID=A0A1T2X0E4_9BACL|nr:zf-HC2 domain-containing protein [Paenibacillus selenitireducens]OPA73354.1 anti-sigma factor [Paenibacillus selenitireducens]
MDCKQALSLMHDYMDNELAPNQVLLLKEHFAVCPACTERYDQLERTEMMLFGIKTQRIEPMADFVTANIMASLPKKTKQRVWLRWVKNHPAITVAAMFVMVMFISALSFWNQDRELMVKGPDLDKLIIEGDKVIVPKGHVVAGDLTVQNGQAEVYGEVNGNLTVIEGSMNLASTAHISGQVTKIDEAMSWLWYRITHMFSGVAYN